MGCIAMLDRGKFNVLGVKIDAVDYTASVNRIVVAAKANQPLGVTALAVHGVMTGVLNRPHRYRLNQLDLVVPDGQPVRWALNLLHSTQLSDRVYGPSLMLKTCEQAAKSGIPIFLFGSDEATLQSLKKNLTVRFPHLEISGVRPSLFRKLSVPEKQTLIEEIRNSGAKICFVGLGCPRQEIFTYEVCNSLRMPTIAVGAAYAFHAGRLSQAPEWMQKKGLEWLYRFTKEPLRLWKRYAVLNPLYLVLLAAQASKIHRFNSDNDTKPSAEIRFG